MDKSSELRLLHLIQHFPVPIYPGGIDLNPKSGKIPAEKLGKALLHGIIPEVKSDIYNTEEVFLNAENVHFIEHYRASEPA